MEGGRTAGRGIEWDAFLGILARETRTAMGRDLATTAEPLSELSVILEAIEATRQARQAFATAGAPPLDGIPDIRPGLVRSRTAGSILDGNDLISILPVLEAAARLAGYGPTCSVATFG